VVTAPTYDELSRVATKVVAGAGLAAETTVNTYDSIAGATDHAGYANKGKLTDATRTVAAQTVGTVALPAVNDTVRYDYDAAGRLLRQRHAGILGGERTLASEYWANGAVKRKQMADGTWTGNHIYDAAGRLSSIDNVLAGPDLFIGAIAYNARGQTASIVYGNADRVDYGYDADRGWLKTLKTTGVSPALDLTYTRNKVGQIATIAAPASRGAAGFPPCDRTRPPCMRRSAPSNCIGEDNRRPGGVSRIARTQSARPQGGPAGRP
jgi:hypothetical protein